MFFGEPVYNWLKIVYGPTTGSGQFNVDTLFLSGGSSSPPPPHRHLPGHIQPRLRHFSLSVTQEFVAGV